MEEEESPAFWEPPTRFSTRPRPILHSSLLIILIPSLVILFTVFILLPSIINTYTHTHKPNTPLPHSHSKSISIRKSWDSLNIVLVVFAILCGVFARRNDDVPPKEERGAVSEGRRIKSEEAGARRWGGHAEQRIPSPGNGGMSGLRRTVSEIPPAQHQYNQWDTGNDRLRFFDDFNFHYQYQYQYQNQRNYHVPAMKDQEERVLRGRMKLEQRIVSPGGMTGNGMSRLRRTVSEMPPVQQQYHGSDDTGNDRLRFFDDFNFHYQWFHPGVVNRVGVDNSPSGPEGGGGLVKEIEVDTFVLETRGELPSPSITPPPSPPHAPPDTPPPTPPPARAQHTFQSVPRRTPAPPPPAPPPVKEHTFPTSERAPHPPTTRRSARASHAPPAPPPSDNHTTRRRRSHSIHTEEIVSHAPPTTPPPPPPRTPPVSHGWGEKKKRSTRKKINATKEIGQIATAIASFYNHRKRKRKQKSSEKPNDEHSPPCPRPPMAESTPPSPAPPPPPPPPPPSMFHSLFRKKTKSKKVHSLSSSTHAPPPPPLPPQRPPHSIGKPPLPPRSIIDLYDRDQESVPNSGCQSPLIPIPPPPPPPPSAAMRFGRYNEVRWGMKGGDATRSGKMEGEDEEKESETMSVTSSINTTACPSPDVNAKADTFIARHHSGWRLEKLNSWREKSGPSGPNSRPTF